MKLYLIICACMSLITFILYGIDKSRAINNKWRIKETTLLMASILFGACGGLLAMIVFRHKTKKWYFILVNVLFLIIHILIGIHINK